MPRGPLPTGVAARRNKPTIPTTVLPASGRKPPVPKPPLEYQFGSHAKDWWAWAWRTPQAAAWDDGSLFMVARRAQLEDDLHLLEHVELDLGELIGQDPDEVILFLAFMVRQLKALAGGKLGVAREMRELDDRLGLTPKGLAQLRWKIVADEDLEEKKPGPGRGRLVAMEGGKADPRKMLGG